MDQLAIRRRLATRGPVAGCSTQLPSPGADAISRPDRFLGLWHLSRPVDPAPPCARQSRFERLLRRESSRKSGADPSSP